MRALGGAQNRHNETYAKHYQGRRGTVAEKIIGPFTFPTRKAAEEEVKRILHGTQFRQPLTGPEYDLISSLVTCHPESETKIGSGILSIEVRQIEFGHPGFWITRTDGSSLDFSYRKALDGAPSHRQQVHAALRWAVRYQIDAFRVETFTLYSDDYGQVTCPLTDEPITTSNAHVDHIIPFRVLVEHFVSTIIGGYNKVIVKPSEEHAGPELVNVDQRNKWRLYHSHLAQLRIVYPSANLARYRAQR